MVDITLLSLFIPTFFFVSITPGMCMTLALSLGLSHGIRKTLPMMMGELLGVATVAITAVLGIAAFLLKFPLLFQIFKVLGASYLIYISYGMWKSTGKFSIDIEAKETAAVALFQQGFFTAIANPKGWAFMVSLLPPFINQSLPLAPQLSLLIIIILLSEFICMMIYASGGKTLAKFMNSDDNGQKLNRISAILMFFVAIWLLIG